MRADAISVLTKALGSLVLVGGAVRDMLLGREGGDWDLATAMMPEEVLRRAKAARLRAIPTGLQHGTVTVLVDHQPFEITTFRKDGPYPDGRRPAHVTLGVALEEDLARRDFTINAMALPLEAMHAGDWRDRVIDPFHGRADLEAKLIRAVGDPLHRFAEDGLRCLRACRFASQLGFELDPATLAAIPERLEVARKVSVERVFSELTKLLQGKEPARGLRLMERTGLLDLWLPELRPMVGCGQNHYHHLDVWEHTLATFTAEETGRADLRWALLLHDAGKPATRATDAEGHVHFLGHEAISARCALDILARLRAANQLREQVQGLIARHGDYPDENWSSAAYRRLLKRLMDSGVDVESWGRMRLADQYGKGWAACERTPGGSTGAQWWADTQAHWRAILARLESARIPGMNIKELALGSHALMALAGRKAGPWLGSLQNHLLEAVLEDPELNRPEELKRLAETWLEANP